MNNENANNEHDDNHCPDDSEEDVARVTPEETITDNTKELASIISDMSDAGSSVESYLKTDDGTVENIYDDEDVFEIGIPILDSRVSASQTDAEVLEPAIPLEAEPESGDQALGSPVEGAVSGEGILLAIKTQMEELSAAFESKLKYDEHKNKIIDDLHQSLQQHREGLLKKYLHRIVMDVIKVVDDMRKLTAHYNQQPTSDDTSLKLLKYIENIASDLEDMFSWEGVVPFTCDGNVVDPARQRVLSKIDTNDPEKDKTIAERLRPGYEWDGKIIRPEMVSAYIYQTNSPSGN